MSRAHRWDPVCKPPSGLVRPVRVDLAGARGPTPGQARGRRWRRVGKGLYVASTADRTLPEQRVLEAAALLPGGGAVTGWAALRMHGAGFFDGLGPDGITMLPVPLNLGPHQSRRARDGVAWSADRLDPDDLSPVQGVPCTTPERAVFDEMRRSDGIRTAVTVMDMAAAASLTSIERVRRYAERHGRWPGVPLVRAALELASENSRSPRETELRLVWVLDAGLPRPRANTPIFDARTGRLLGIADLLDEAAGLVGEFDGGEHAGARRRSRDAARDDAFRDHELETFRITGFDLHSPAVVVERILAARARARWIPQDRRTWTTVPPSWWEEPRSLDEILTERDLIRETQTAWEAELAAEGANAARLRSNRS